MTDEAPKKKGMSMSTLTSIIAAIVGGILMALQGVTLHQTEGVQKETVRVGAETSAELSAIMKLQVSANEQLDRIKKLQENSVAELAAWNELRGRVEIAMDKQGKLMDLATVGMDRQTKLLDMAVANEKRIESSIEALPKPSPSPSP
jgi:hypothetical protein